MQRTARHIRRATFTLAAILGAGTAYSSGCFDSAIAQRFRDAASPGITAGVSSAITDPTNAEAGLRDAAAAIMTGIGAVVETRDSGQTSSGA